MLGLIKMILKKFSCKSKCSFNNQEYDFNLGDLKLNQFELKNKDINTIYGILSKRKSKQNALIITDV
tara:strand:- start:333 stop:533 length:201 start_codon:yes stop_codon:yes gene_type:complete